MKTKEFISKLDELGYNVQDGEGCSYEIHDANADFIGEVSREMNNVLRLHTDDYELIELCSEYAKTPIEEREVEKL